MFRKGWVVTFLFASWLEGLSFFPRRMWFITVGSTGYQKLHWTLAALSLSSYFCGSVFRVPYLT
jgi:hypothetical protein